MKSRFWILFLVLSLGSLPAHAARRDKQHDSPVVQHNPVVNRDATYGDDTLGPVTTHEERYENYKTVDRSDPYAMVKAFVNLEFRGVSVLRDWFAHFTPDSWENTRIAKTEKRCDKVDSSECGGDIGNLGRVLNSDSSNLFVVTRYTILSIDIRGDRGVAVVDYDRLASAVMVKHIWRRLFVDRKDHDWVELHLRRRNGQWRIVNPPLWRLSIDALIQGCNEHQKDKVFGKSKDMWKITESLRRVDFQAYPEGDGCADAEFVSVTRKDKDTLRNLLGDAPTRHPPTLAPAVTMAGEKARVETSPSPTRPTEIDQTDPRRVAEALIAGEFRGDLTLRPRLVLPAAPGSLDLEHPKTERICTNQGCTDHIIPPLPPNRVLDFLHDAWFAISVYHIRHVKVTGTQAVVEVSFDQVAGTYRFNNDQRRIIKDWGGASHANLNLVRQGERWFVVDPPPPRIGLEHLLRLYRGIEHHLAFSPVLFDPTAPLFQWQEDFNRLRYLFNWDYHYLHLERGRWANWIWNSREIAKEHIRDAEEQRAWEQADQALRQNQAQTPPEPPPPPPSHWQAMQGSPGVWREPESGLTFVWVPGGTYWMGCAPWQAVCFEDERPVHLVTVDGFWLGTHAVTRTEWLALMGKAPPLSEEEQEELEHKANVVDPDYAGWWEKFDRYKRELRQLDWPMADASWEQARAFVKKLNTISGETFRLPTEAEWEYACRNRGQDDKATTNPEKPIDDDYPTGYPDLSLAALTGKGANSLGLIGMPARSGEWVQDFFDDAGYLWHQRHNPLVPGRGRMVVRQGYSLLHVNPIMHACFYRMHVPWGVRKAGRAGLRLARSP
ncbi:MAG: SUMF1/EgtB/PvdO family nonheme iron enzyme [Magnetococcales bacterium]|nr:SUMF1/EgtB/PvdO family nonheme iron enzyme [Magnetococcales bacterium]